MKIRTVYILIILTAGAVGVVFTASRQRTVDVVPAPEPAAEPPPIAQVIEPVAEPVAQPEPPPLPKPRQETTVSTARQRAPTQPTRNPPPNYNPAASRYWQQAAQQFERQLNALNQETDPAKRLRLIQTMSRYVQIDTLGAIDWAMSLADNPAEQRAALEAINQNALVGIGARIQMDSSGLPKIMDTTVLSAIESTGMAGAGDLIAGVVKPDGTTVYFDGMPIQEVVQHLRGEAGTEVQLLMERESQDGDTDTFDVTFPRSMIVMPPPN